MSSAKRWPVLAEPAELVVMSSPQSQAGAHWACWGCQYAQQSGAMGAVRFDSSRQEHCRAGTCVQMAGTTCWPQHVLGYRAIAA